MSRYIDADKIPWTDLNDNLNSNIKVLVTFAEKVNRMPTADVRENVRGEWLPHPNKQNKEWDVCSACGIGCKRREYGIHANGRKWVTEYNFPFCPNCGADMRGKERNL